MTTDIFIKSYPADFGWLAYCLRSLEKFATGFRNIIVMIPRGSSLPLTKEHIIYSDDHGDGYLFQQYCKLTADLHSDADYILHIDSDSILKRTVTPATFMQDGKVRWLMTPWEDCMDAKKAWFHVQARLFMEAPTHDFMRRNTVMVPRFAYGALRDFIKERHGHAMDAYVMNVPNREFSEYNALGYFLWRNHRESIAWHDTAKLGVPEVTEIQNWSWGGLTPEIRAKMDEVLK